MDTTESGTIYVLTVESSKATVLFTRETEGAALGLFAQWTCIASAYRERRIRLIKLDGVPGASHWDRAYWVRENRMAMDDYRTRPAMRVAINFRGQS